MGQAAIERHDPAGTIELAGSPASLALLGTTDPMAAIERAIALADLFMRVLRERQLATKFGDSDRDFIELGGWQVLAAEVGVAAIVTGTSAIDGGFESRAEVRTPDGRVIGAASAMCTSDEPNWRSRRPHDRRAMAETRAVRRALRLVLGFIPALAGLDIADPDAPATRKQIVALHTIAGQLGWDHEESHRRAGVESFTFLNRSTAAALQQEWSELSPETLPEGSATPSPPPPALTLEDAWAAAVKRHGSKVGVLKAALERWPSDVGVSAASLTLDELLELTKEGSAP